MEFHLPAIIFLVSIVIILTILIKAGLQRLGIPALVGYLLLGFALRSVDAWWAILSEPAWEILEFLAKLGVIALLFRIGLESHLRGLLKQLRRASVIWIVNIAATMVPGYIIASRVLGFAMMPSLFVATALAATSVGISVGAWHECGAIESSTGELLVDVAELDDLSSITFMAVLFATVPVIQAGSGQEALLSKVLVSIGIILMKLILFGLGCFLFSQYAEHSLTHWFQKIQVPQEPMLLIVSLGILLGAVAALLGFSMAIGAFFAGLVFSRDPEAVQIDASFGALYELFSPFFFIGIGLRIQPSALINGWRMGLILVVVAVITKVLGTAIPAVFTTGWRGATLLGISMIPRAEIAMIVIEQGTQKGQEILSPQLYAAMVLVAAATCLGSPLAIRALLQKWPQTSGS